jgi:hypothetical protein
MHMVFDPAQAGDIAPTRLLLLHARDRTTSFVAAALAPESVGVMSGGHDRPASRKLWENFLDARFTMHCPQGCNRRHQ